MSRDSTHLLAVHMNRNSKVIPGKLAFENATRIVCEGIGNCAIISFFNALHGVNRFSISEEESRHLKTPVFHLILSVISQLSLDDVKKKLQLTDEEQKEIILKNGLQQRAETIRFALNLPHANKAAKMERRNFLFLRQTIEAEFMRHNVYQDVEIFRIFSEAYKVNICVMQCDYRLNGGYEIYSAQGCTQAPAFFMPYHKSRKVNDIKTCLLFYHTSNCQRNSNGLWDIKQSYNHFEALHVNDKSIKIQPIRNFYLPDFKDIFIEGNSDDEDDPGHATTEFDKLKYSGYLLAKKQQKRAYNKALYADTGDKVRENQRNGYSLKKRKNIELAVDPKDKNRRKNTKNNELLQDYSDVSEIEGVVSNTKTCRQVRYRRNAVKEKTQRVNRYSLKKNTAPKLSKNCVNKHPGAVNVSAAIYGTALENKTEFELCAICMTEDSRLKMISREDVENEIEKSNIKNLYEENVLNRLESDDIFEKSYAQSFTNYFDISGLLKGCEFVCSKCVRQLPKIRKKARPVDDVVDGITCGVFSDDDDNDDVVGLVNEVTRVSEPSGLFASVPKESLLFGLWPGEIPKELQDLTGVERSMISIYSAITKLTLRSGKYAHAHGATSYVVVNDLISVAKQLPRMPTPESTAILRSEKYGGGKVKDLCFRPLKVKQALIWLKENNHLYKDIDIGESCWPKEYAGETINWNENDVFVEAATIPLTDDDMECLEEDIRALPEVVDAATAAVQQAQPVEPTTDKEILLVNDPDIVTHLQELREILTKDGRTIVHRPKEFDFVSYLDNPDYIMSKSFPDLFPYGRGCASDKDTKMSKLSDHAYHLLRRGGHPHGRRCQQVSNYIYLNYTFDMRRRIGGVTFQAQRTQFDDGPVDAPKVAEVNQMLAYLTRNTDIELNDVPTEAVLPSPAVLDITRPTLVASITPVAENADKQIEKLIARLVPYSQSLKGSQMHIMYERAKLMAMIPSPVILNNGSWRWFLTFAPANVYDPKLFAIVIDDTIEDSNRTFKYDDRFRQQESLTKEERREYLTKHPALAVRLFHLTQECIWDCILLGNHNPLGHIVDFWRRVEFQRGGNPHVHGMACVRKDGITAEDIEGPNRNKVKGMVASAVTANLLPRSPSGKNSHIDIQEISEQDKAQRIEEECDFDFNPHKRYFVDSSTTKDSHDPRRKTFDATLNYTRKTVFCENSGSILSDEFEDDDVLTQYRRLQLANQMHVCCFTCWKYNVGDDRTCRFNFKTMLAEDFKDDETTIRIDRDKKSRKRVRALPPRNNGNINPCFMDPLLFNALGSNCDIQHVENAVGAAIYAGSYASKAEEPDGIQLRNIFTKKLARLAVKNLPVTDRQRLSAVAHAVINATQVSLQQCCYTLLRLPFVISSRTVINVNTLPEVDIRKPVLTEQEVLDELDPETSAVKCGLNSQLGRRAAYGKLLKNQKLQLLESRSLCAEQEACQITLFSMITHYRLTSADPESKDPVPELAGILEVDNFTGLLKDTSKPANGGPHAFEYMKKFRVDDIIFTEMKTPVIVNLSPHVPVHPDDERSCYSTLLMHVPWPDCFETHDITGEGTTAVERLRLLMPKLPPYVQRFLDIQKTSDDIRANQGNPLDGPSTIETGEVNTAEDDNDIESDDENSINNEDGIPEAEDPAELDDEHTGPMSVIFGPDIPVIENMSCESMSYFQDFVSKSLKKHATQFASEHQISGSEENALLEGGGVIRVKDYRPRLQQLAINVEKLKRGQLDAYNKIKGYLTGQEETPLRMFLTGEGGTGKSEVIKLIMEFTRLHFGKQKGLFGSVISMAPTASAATNIGGITWQSAVGTNITDGGRGPDAMSQMGAKKLAGKIRGTKLFIIDEVSMTSYESHYNISERIKKALLTIEVDPEKREYIKNTPYGGMHMLFCGDLWQLSSMNGTPLYTRLGPLSKGHAVEGQKLWYSINEYDELTENCRFLPTELPVLQSFLSGARVQNADPALIDQLNGQCICSVETAHRKAHKQALWLSPTHEVVNRFNKDAFKALVQDGAAYIRVVATHSTAVVGGSAPNSLDRQKLLELPNKKYNAHLDLAIGQMVRCTDNLASEIGIYNGARGKIVGFGFRKSMPEEPMPRLIDIHCDHSREIPVVFVQMEQDVPYSVSTELPNVIPFTAVCNKSDKYLNSKYNRWQLPLEPAAATTVHSAQGITAKYGVVFSPSPRAPFARGLEYVGISRVTKIEDLYLVGPLKKVHFKSHEIQAAKIKAEYARLETFKTRRRL